MGRYDMLLDMLHTEIMRIQEKGELNATTLEHADKLAHCLKDILAIEAMENREEDRKSYERDTSFRRRY